MPCRRNTGAAPDAYIGEVCIPGLEAAHAEGLVDAVDGFCEGIAFSPEQIAPVFDKARARGIPVKLHAEQLSNLGGASWQPNMARCPPIISNMPRRRCGKAMAESRHCGRHPARRLLHIARDSCAANRGVPQARCADGGRHRLQPRLVADVIAAA
jgi:hypothetical protein